MPSSFHGGAEGVSEVRKRSRRNRIPVPVPLVVGAGARRLGWCAAGRSDLDAAAEREVGPTGGFLDEAELLDNQPHDACEDQLHALGRGHRLAELQWPKLQPTSRRMTSSGLPVRVVILNSG